MYEYKDIKRVHLEVSEVCNAACPMCARVSNGGAKYSSLLKNSTLDLEHFKMVFDEDFVKQLEHINFCGTLGDPITSKDLFEQIDYLLKINSSLKINIDTNGGIRNSTWWESLGKLSKDSQCITVAFSIDGLEDTNHLYRRNVQWNRLISNAKSYISAGGFARWQFIRFNHNEHQVDQAKQMAKELGFKSFIYKDTNRFLKQPDGLYNYPVRNIGDSRETVQYYLQPTSDFKPVESIQKDLDNSCISCKVQSMNEIYIGARGEIFPCCYLYTDYFKFPDRYKHVIETVETLLVTNNRSIKDILNSDVFKKIEQSWNLSSIDEGKLKRCSEVCGINNQVIVKTGF